MENSNMSQNQISSNVRSALPADLLRYIDQTGRVINMPAKKTLRLRLLEYLSTLFEVGRIYSEKEVNHLLVQHLVSSDYATIRRDLCDFHYLQRERDGSRYWRMQLVDEKSECQT